MKEEESVEKGEGGSLSDSSACGGEWVAAAAPCAHSWLQLRTENAGLPGQVFLFPSPWYYPPYTNNQHMGLQEMIYSSPNICGPKDPAAMESSVSEELIPAQKQYSRSLQQLQTAATHNPKGIDANSNLY